MSKLYALLVLVTLLGCSQVTSNNTAATIETTAQVAISSCIAYMKAPVCSETVTERCSTKDVAQKINDSQLGLVSALKVYRAAKVAYVKTPTDDNSALVSNSYSALKVAIDSAKDILSLESVKSVINSK